MSNSFDRPPVDDPLTKPQQLYLSDGYRTYFATLIETLISYLSENGVFLPQLTTTQRNAITTPVNGQMIYNTTLGSAQYFKAGVWTSF